MTKETKIRWWPAALIGLALLGALGGIWLVWDEIRQLKMMATITMSGLALLLLTLWFLLLSRLPWKTRGIGLLGLVLAVFAASQLFEIRGVTGDLRPILSWKWGRTEARQVDAKAGGVPVLAGSEQDSPQFLGRDRNAKIEGVVLARDWKSTPPREVWRAEVGSGWSSFAVWGDLAVDQEQRGEHEQVVAYDLATGVVRWVHSDEARYSSTIGGTGPRATPAIDGVRVYTFGATGVLNALDLATGRELWSIDVVEKYDGKVPEWGKSCSPLLVDDLVVVSAGGEKGRSLVAFDRETGREAWRAGDDRSGYASPMIATLAGVRQIVIFNQASVVGHDPADGRVLWSFDWPAEQPNVAQPLPIGANRLLVSSGYGIGAKMLEITADADGDLEAELVWESPRLKSKFAHYVEHGGYVYGLDDGVFVCLDPETGERCWKRGRYGHGQFLLAGELIVLLAEDGDVVLIEPNPEDLIELSRFAAFDRKTWNIPTLVGPYLLVRNDREAALFELPVVATQALR